MDYKSEITKMVNQTSNYKLLKFIYGILCGAIKEEG